MSQSLPSQLLKELNLKGYKPRIGIEIAGLSKYFSPFKTFSSDVYTYIGEILGAPVISLDVDRLGGFVKAGGMSMSVLNQELFSNIFASGVNPENEEVIVKLFCDDGTAMLDAESVQIFKGKISDFPTIDYGEVNFNIERYDVNKEVTIGELLTDSDAADSDQGLPDWGKGKIKPIIFGDHTFLQGDDAKSNDTANIENNMVPMVYLGIDSNDKHNWWVSADKMNEILVAGDQKQIWAWDDRIGRYVRNSSGITVVQNDSNGCIISHTVSPQFIDYWYSSGTITSTTGGPFVLDFANKSRAGDKLFSDYSIGTIGDGSDSNSFIQLNIPFPDYDNDIGTFAGAAVVIYCAMIYGGGGGDGDFDLEVGPTPTGLLQTDDHPKEGGTYPEARQESDELATATETIKVKLSKNNNDPNPTCQLKVYEVYKKVAYNPGRLLPLFFAGKGNEYGTWINDREAGVDDDPHGVPYTETHVDHDVEADFGTGAPEVLIENAAGVIESIARDEIGLNTEIDLAQFNIASNDLSTSKLSFAITEQIKATRLMDSIAKKVKSALFYDFDNELNMKVFVSGDPFTASGDSVANNQDIFEFDPQSVFKIVTGENDKLRVQVTNFTLTAGDYTGASLASHIQSKIQITYADIDCDYSTNTGKFTFTETAAGSGYDFDWSSQSANNTVGRFLAFDISADDTLPLGGTLVSDNQLWVDSFVEHPITEDSFRLRKTTDDIVTSITVKYYPNHEGNFQATRTATDSTFHAETLKETFEHPFTRDQTTVDIYRDFLVKSDGTGRLCKRYYEVEDVTWLNGVIFEPFDIVNNRHPILAGIFSDENVVKWGVVGSRIDLGSMEVKITSTQLNTP